MNDLKKMKKLGIENVRCYHKKRGCKSIDIQDYYFRKKKKHPERYERLDFDTNGSIASSKTLSEIIFDFKLCGTLDFEGNILL